MVSSVQKLKSAVLALFLLLGFVLPSLAEVTFATGKLTILTTTGEKREFDVEWAISMEQRARGLMQREQLADDAGMLFDFGESRMVTMWMANTPLSLDMLFINETGRIVRVAERTTPFSEAIVGSGEPVRYVLEIRGGRAGELGITAGGRLNLPLAVPNGPQP
ncbi:protein of unknown function DUF192 [Rhizobium sp. PDO1-076]|uniref:DUF192 domain-containing protein n=1 Tax=Rhizobium sp. PDO1-076 TaxID=1125979 RepID=UPI00024E34A2|nr:DUF192 domain-containing protein [Rhizobium sp. PDO1-076]EHS49657.1 protein of unknown function DUF192 [Rhizobium sp. PDO1-076]